MKVSTKTRYGVRFMIDLAQHQNEGCVALKEVAERQGISKKYLEQVVSPWPVRVCSKSPGAIWEAIDWPATPRTLPWLKWWMPPKMGSLS